MFLRLCVLALKIERHSRSQVTFIQIGRLVECLAVEGESLVLFAVAAQLLTLLHQVCRTTGSRSWRRRLGAEPKTASRKGAQMTRIIAFRSMKSSSAQRLCHGC